MAARSDAAATPGPKDGAFMSFNLVSSPPNNLTLPLIHKEITSKHIYARQSLLEISSAYKHQLSAATEKLRGLSKPQPRPMLLPAQSGVASGVREREDTCALKCSLTGK